MIGNVGFALLRDDGLKSLKHRRMGRGGEGGEGLQSSPPNLGNLDFFGQQKKFGQSRFLKKFASSCVCACCCFFSKRNIFYFNLKSAR